MARILLTSFGSYGDLHPYLALGVELQARGHRVTLATSEIYRDKVEGEGLRLHVTRPDLVVDDGKLLEYFMHRRHGSQRVIEWVCSGVRETYADIAAAAVDADVIVTHPITFAAVVAAQKLGMPWISTVLAPISFLSAFDPPVVAGAPWLAYMRVFGPGFMKRFWDVARRVSREWTRPILDLRLELGLPPGEHAIFEGSHSPRLVLALFSRYMAAPQPDWPPNTVVTGFPFYDHPQPDALAEFFDAGPAPVVFTLGSSAVGAAGQFYVDSLRAVERLGIRALFLTGRHPQGLPDRLPQGVMTVEYAPHAQVFARAAAIVHQGGVGTMAQAMRAGKPTLVVPFAHDQYDNAERMRRCGVAEWLGRPKYNARTAEAKLKLLLRNPAYARAGAELGPKVEAENGTSQACDRIERFIRTA